MREIEGEEFCFEGIEARRVVMQEIEGRIRFGVW